MLRRFFCTKQSTPMYTILDTKTSIVSNTCVSELEVVNPHHWSFLMANSKCKGLLPHLKKNSWR